MSSYVFNNSPEINKFIQNQLDVALEELTKLDGVISIVLVGGFGRGEGSVKKTKDTIKPLNDYDIYLVTTSDLSEELLNQTAISIEKKLGSEGFSLSEQSKKDFYFDLRPIPYDKLSSLPPFIKYYEMKHASIILWGEDIRPLLPDRDPQNLPISEGFRFLLNRLSSIFLWHPYLPQYLTTPWPEWLHNVFFYDISKIYIEMNTLLCQFLSCYQPTYFGRLQALKTIQSKELIELSKIRPGILDRISRYTLLKLEPNYPSKLSHKIYRNIWLVARDDALAVLSYVLKRKYNLGLSQLGSVRFSYIYFEQYVLNTLQSKFGAKVAHFLKIPGFIGSQLYLKLLWLTRLKSFNKLEIKHIIGWLDPGLQIFQSLLYFAAAAKKDFYFDQELVEKGCRKVSAFYQCQETYDPYRQFLFAHKAYEEAWKKYFFMKLTNA